MEEIKQYKYGKLIDGRLVYSAKQIEEGGRWVLNPTPEILTELGYKPVVDNHEPHEGMVSVPFYEEDEDFIYINYTYEVAELEEPYVPTEEELKKMAESRKQRFLKDFIITPYGSIRKKTSIGDFIAVLPNITTLVQATGKLEAGTILFYETPDFTEDITEKWLLEHQYFNEEWSGEKYMEFLGVLTTAFKAIFRGE